MNTPSEIDGGDLNFSTSQPLLIFFMLKADFKNLQSLEICDGFLTDDEMDIIKGLTSLELLNLSNDAFLRDMTLESISGVAIKIQSIDYSSLLLS